MDLTGEYYEGLNTYVYTIHDLLINMDKHERGTDSFKWFEEAPKKEREIMIAEAYAIIDLIYRLIEKSKDNKVK